MAICCLNQCETRSDFMISMSKTIMNVGHSPAFSGTVGTPSMHFKLKLLFFDVIEGDTEWSGFSVGNGGR